MRRRRHDGHVGRRRRGGRVERAEHRETSDRQQPEDDARAAGMVRAELEAVGKPVGASDVLLAGQARRRGATLVTSTAKEFARVRGLKWEDWAVPRR